jgi:hypothetical protein
LLNGTREFDLALRTFAGSRIGTGMYEKDNLKRELSFSMGRVE